ncbi:sensor histidine kinase RegB [Primorskyibacter sp. S187A]|uniref:sensor histidine kinase RegB n=1 Tax=Primorskyibacter sp. S187A TaxID=3415130 RepID=UPI003C7C9838
MSDSPSEFTMNRQRGNWIRLRTMILLRWVAIVGQMTALIVAQRYFSLQLELGLCYLAIGVSVVGNLIAIAVFPENKRLSETENTLMALFDLLQLSFLIYLTGGLNNPFSLLILGPVLVSAAVLTTGPTVFLAGIALILVTLLTQFHLPLRTEQGFILRIPDVFIFGKWIAIVIAVVFLTAYSRRITIEMHSMSDALSATQMALSREQKLTDLGGVVAAAAHELGTPLATIKLTSSELIDDLSDRPELREDVELIRDQADRCRDILQSMGRAGKADKHVQSAPLSEIIQIAAEPHEGRGKMLVFDGQSGHDIPTIARAPELIHGIRNLIQNAVDFARANVWIETRWTEDTISVRILDDGMGYPPHLIGRIGEPFVRKRRSEADRKARPEYEGMGLGLFIAKTLLERSGAELSFANGSDPYDNAHSRPEKCGAIVEVIWPRASIEMTTPVTGENQQITI